VIVGVDDDEFVDNECDTDDIEKGLPIAVESSLRFDSLRDDRADLRAFLLEDSAKARELLIGEDKNLDEDCNFGKGEEKI
jgi:hypothetical protein